MTWICEIHYTMFSLKRKDLQDYLKITVLSKYSVLSIVKIVFAKALKLSFKHLDDKSKQYKR